VPPDSTDRAIINLLQDGIAVCERPFEAPAWVLGLQEAVLIDRLRALLHGGVLSRFGPMFDAERLGGAFTLCAMQVPAAQLETVAAVVNGFTEVAHNYEREHEYNMWFVIGAASRTRIDEVIEAIEACTGIEVLDLPKEQEFFVGLRLEA
jgi:DNA-binding Lrp family transcriptional regulator